MHALSYAPGFAGGIVAASFPASFLGMRGQRRALGALFFVLALAFAGIAYAALSSDAGQARRIVVAVAAAALALWLATMAARALR